LSYGVLGALDPTLTTNRRSQRALILVLSLLAAAAIGIPLSPLAAPLFFLSLLLAHFLLGHRDLN